MEIIMRYPNGVSKALTFSYDDGCETDKRLADILGHSSVNTTRVYTIETGDVHRKQLHLLGLVRMNV